jgi:2-dehydropantoate 2-reductase
MAAEGAFDSAVVLGAGAVGSYLGARLSRVVPTLLVGRAAHVRAIRERGLRLTGLVDERVELDAAEEAPPLGPRSLVLVAVKLRDLEAAAAVLAERARGEVTILCCQNGLDPDARLRRALDDRLRGGLTVLRALTAAGLNLVRPGEVEYWGGGLTFPAAEEARPAVDLFRGAGVEVAVEAEFGRAVWLKFCVNCVVNPLSAILGVRNREVAAPELATLRRAIVDEVARCAADAGVALAADLHEAVDRAISGSNNRNSMLQDVAYGRPTEVDDLNGLVVRLAAERGRDAPACRTVTLLVKFLEGAGER